MKVAVDSCSVDCFIMTKRSDEIVIDHSDDPGIWSC